VNRHAVQSLEEQTSERGAREEKGKRVGGGSVTEEARPYHFLHPLSSAPRVGDRLEVGEDEAGFDGLEGGPVVEDDEQDDLVGEKLRVDKPSETSQSQSAPDYCKAKCRSPSG
jgi:hypothetical protein